jgi:hypothetical protein
MASGGKTMTFLEKWYWANFIRGTNPVTTFAKGLVLGIWIPLLLSAIFCLLTDPQWNHKESISGFSFTAYGNYYVFFWKTVFQAIWHFTCLYASYLWNHMGSIVRWVRHLLWLDHPEYFDGVGNN